MSEPSNLRSRLNERAPGVWHKDGPLAQVRSMAQWAREESLGTYPNRETLGKIAANLDAAADALEGALHV